MAPRVLVSTTPFGEIDPRPLEMLTSAGVDYVLNPLGRRPREEELAEMIRGGYDAVIAGLEPFTPRVLDAAAGLRFISRATVGLETVDLHAARERDVLVAHTPGANAEAVAQLALGHLLALLRGVRRSHEALARGEWFQHMGRTLDEITLGVIGVGRIGKRVIRHVAGFGAHVIANDLAPDTQFGARYGVEWAEKEEIYRRADAISLHVPATPMTLHLIGAAELAMMRKGAYLINTARGVVVDDEALARALGAGHLGGAAVDVFPEEPYRGVLAHAPNCILTAHLGARTRSSRLQMEVDATENVLCFLAGRPIPGLVPETEYEMQRIAPADAHSPAPSEETYDAQNA